MATPRQREAADRRLDAAERVSLRTATSSCTVQGHTGVQGRSGEITAEALGCGNPTGNTLPLRTKVRRGSAHDQRNEQTSRGPHAINAALTMTLRQDVAPYRGGPERE